MNPRDFFCEPRVAGIGRCQVPSASNLHPNRRFHWATVGRAHSNSITLAHVCSKRTNTRIKPFLPAHLRLHFLHRPLCCTSRDGVSYNLHQHLQSWRGNPANAPIPFAQKVQQVHSPDRQHAKRDQELITVLVVRSVLRGEQHHCAFMSATFDGKK